jgi:hypothetical protein
MCLQLFSHVCEHLTPKYEETREDMRHVTLKLLSGDPNLSTDIFTGDALNFTVTSYQGTLDYTFRFQIVPTRVLVLVFVTPHYSFALLLKYFSFVSHLSLRFFPSVYSFLSLCLFSSFFCLCWFLWLFSLLRIPFHRHFIQSTNKLPGSSVSIVSDYGLDYRAIEVRFPAEAKDFSSSLCVQTGSGAHPASCTMGTGGLFPGGNRRRAMTLTTHPHLVPRSWMNRSYTSSPRTCLRGCSGTALASAFNLWR